MIDFVDPVGEQQMRMAAPTVLREPGRIVGRKIAFRKLGRAIAVVLGRERAGVIFKMVEHVQHAVSTVVDEASADFGASRKNMQSFCARQSGWANFCPAGNRNIKCI